jgi:anthranilate phosphoribosyltransferase
VSSTCGSADVLEALGVNLGLTPEQVGRCIDQIGIGFMFAPNFHGAMKYAAPVRKELGVRTIFNVLGPLTNPAGAENQVLGVFHPDLVGIQARVLQRLGSRHVLVVHGADGMDEISISDRTFVAELKDDKVTEYTIHPEQFGMATTPLDRLKVGNINEACEKLSGVLNGQAGGPRDIVQLNAGAAIYVAGLADSLEAGVEKAGQVIANGAAKARLDQLIALSNSFKA